eukprot:Hpha_TRINITY_DN18358_c0_g1::TRINITY_DN18358_c0_g1_i1::g.158190::m.158190
MLLELISRPFVREDDDVDTRRKKVICDVFQLWSSSSVIFVLTCLFGFFAVVQCMKGEMTFYTLGVFMGLCTLLVVMLMLRFAGVTATLRFAVFGFTITAICNDLNTAAVAHACETQGCRGGGRL